MSSPVKGVDEASANANVACHSISGLGEFILAADLNRCQHILYMESANRNDKKYTQFRGSDVMMHIRMTTASSKILCQARETILALLDNTPQSASGVVAAIEHITTSFSNGVLCIVGMDVSGLARSWQLLYYATTEMLKAVSLSHVLRPGSLNNGDY